MRTSFFIIGFLLVSPCPFILNIAHSRPVERRDFATIWTDIQDAVDVKAANIPYIGKFIESPISSVFTLIGKVGGVVSTVALWSAAKAVKVAAKAAYHTVVGGGSLVFGAIFGKRSSEDPQVVELYKILDQYNNKDLASDSSFKDVVRDDQEQQLLSEEHEAEKDCDDDSRTRAQEDKSPDKYLSNIEKDNWGSGLFGSGII